MAIQKFLKLVEIQTKAASMIPFLLGTVYALFRFQQFNAYHFGLMLVSLLSFDMATTAINNYYDYRKAVKKHGYGYEVHNAIVQYNIKPSAVVAVIAILLTLAVGAGILLFLEVGLLLLLLGGLSFAVGILYSFGPIPISRMPLGEIFSGLFMGFVIIFISAYIHVGERIASLTLTGGTAVLQVQLVEVILVFFVSIPAILGIANIMLANNICDMEDDIENKRYTLPVYIGRPNAMILFKMLYYAAYLDLIVLCALRVHPVIVVFVLFTLLPVRKNIKRFADQPTKQFTFGLSVQNFMLTNAARIVALGLAAIMML
ncbi:1,4-dihydroxy-2-naphthoate polyprenyltransferase [Paenibacillus woosongensis]|uniref:1,4-dihydroxy-2-naphthoate polyprenyltransferase n=1 Tax=Paenibacillus woosongensis TaxID=307580 RepID=A0A7X2Z3L7_9BACL|nr:1,4-dihydroxy-2-naphthoate polyprenyltransferase [Paenibacillus woosongensis]MUG46880.1 1,4-dihydroxy-2-naphthoate polyprenyltransferase [Paenibacillus woosongensis]